MRKLKTLTTLKPLLALLALMALIALTSCRSVQTATESVERSVRTDTLRVLQLEKDSVFLHDSIYIKEYQRGDTIFLTKHVYNTAWRERVRRDTVYRSKTDTLYQERIKEVEKERTIRWYEKALAIFAALCGLGLVVFAVARN